ncbi:pyrin-like [Scleropages formosus]|uniref:pyrin-like n=1 Tax=Scleropages formosus TaxID=113540 RepID=UPI0010FA963D|nr:pyrin-like [Scleropages formosus]
MDNVYENLQVQPCHLHEPNEEPKKNMAVRQRSDVENELKEFQNTTSMQISGLQKQLDEKNTDNFMLIEQSVHLQNELKELQTAKEILSQWSGKEGVILPPVWKWIREAAVDVTLDLNTAHGNLIVSQDKKEVRYTETPQNHPKKPESFDSWYGVLGKESFSSGRFYYEVQVSQKACYVVGVVKESIKRKESITPNTAKGFWTVTFKDKTYTAAGDPPVSIDIREKPQKVGVYVDYEEGQVSFYNVETRSHIYTFTGKEEIVPNTVWKWLRKAAVDVTLDPVTANPWLILSKDKKQVRHGDTKQNLPDNPQRFSPVVSVLGKQGFSSGRNYWEVQVGDKNKWTLGVARESINRKGKIKLSPNNGYWTIWLRNKNEYKALAESSVFLNLSVKPQKVGMYVDYEEGQVSFYNVEARSHIYTFTGYRFTEKLCPYFSLGTDDDADDGTSSGPLIITSVSPTA